MSHQIPPDIVRCKASDTGFVYCIRDGYKRAVKIGFSKNPNRRLNQLQTASATLLELCGQISTTQSYERHLQRLFADRSIFGEWFDDKDESISSMFKMMGDFDK